jgi:uncharacterized lipoprotein YddW (UPF0748 family)
MVSTIILFVNLGLAGVWIPRWSITDHNEIFGCLGGAFDHIFLQVYAAGEAYYPSKYAPSRIKSDQWLKDFLAEAHRRHIKVSAWINTFYSWGYAPWPADTRHPINRHPNWYVQDRYGRSILEYSVDELKRLRIEGYYLAPGHFEVQSHIIKIVDELLQYDFDGIHLDYIRYPGTDFVYDPMLRTKFMRSYYVDPQDIAERPDEFRQRFGIWGYDELRERWDAYINDDLTQFIQRLSREIKDRDATCALSIAAKPDYLNARRYFHQAWTDWLRLGLIDFVCLMAYNRDLKPILDKVLKAVDNKEQIMVGLGLYLLSPQEIADQVRLTRSLGFGGLVFFSYEELKKDKTYLNTLK